MEQLPRVLLVEDNESVSRATRRDLEVAGWRVDVAARLDVALEWVSHERYRLLVIDLGLPDAKGVEAVSALAHAHGGAIVVYTGDASESTRSAAIAAGARAVVIKGDGRLSESVESLREHAHADDLEDILAKRPPPKGCP